jgi:hypothetical protein
MTAARPLIRRIALQATLLLPAVALLAQTHDDARLTMGISAGFIGAKHIWDVPNQPVLSVFDGPDIFHIGRELRSDITISGQGTYFRGPHFGVTGEFTYVGLGATDACAVVQDGGDAELRAACAALSGDERSSSGTVVQGGFVFRPFTRTGLQPYLKALGGLAFAPSSTMEMTSVYGSVGDTLLTLTIYPDDHWKSVRPTATLAFGISTAPSSGYQLHIEARETFLALTEVTGPSGGQGFVPPHRSAFIGVPSLLVGFDIVLERRRGRRY